MYNMNKEEEAFRGGLYNDQTLTQLRAIENV